MEDRYEIHVNPGYGKPRFGKTEIRDIAVSVAVMAAAFAILYSDSGFVTHYLMSIAGSEAGMYALLFGMSLLLVAMSFLLHEFGHKFVAQDAGLWSEYRMYPVGLALTLATSFFGFLFAAPGAVYIAGNMDDRTNGRVSIAGPAVNIVLALVGILLCVLLNGTPAVVFAYLLASLNSFLALFNLLPVPPLDGSKIIRWNTALWVAAIAVAAVELVAVLNLDVYYYL